MALSKSKRNSLPQSAFHGPHDSFPIVNAETARAAMRLAPRSEHAGNISKQTENRIESYAHNFLAKKGK